MSGVFSCNSGTEPNEAAIKLARERAFRNGEPERTTLACEGSFHGRTLGSLSATSNPRHHEGFGPLPSDFAFVPFNDVDALEARLDRKVAALIVEPVQGERSVHVATDAFLRAARRLCNEHEALLIFDEVQCGMRRMDSLFAFEPFGVVPDVVTVAKALANGVPVGALLVGARAAGGFEPGDHGSTFGCSPLAAAAALAHLRIREEVGLDRCIAQRPVQFFERLAQLASRFPTVFGPPRGKGLLAGLPVRAPHNAENLVTSAREIGLLLGTAGENTVRFAPPLVVSKQQLNYAYGTLTLVAAAHSGLACRLQGLS